MRAREQTRRAARRFCSSSLPEHIELTMPALSPTMEQGTIAEWKVNVGDEIGAGDVIAEVETDKATVAFESVEEGFLAKILMEPGTEVPVGTLVAIMAENEDDVAAFANYTPAESAAEAASPPPPPVEEKPAAKPAAAPAAPAKETTPAPAAPAPAQTAPVAIAASTVSLDAEGVDYGEMEVIQDDWSGWYVVQVGK